MARKPVDPKLFPKPSEFTNALRPMRIDVSDDDINKGNRMDPTACAAARSILRMPGVDAVHVHRGITAVRMKGKWVRYMTPASLRVETIVFDRGGQFVAGYYDLKPVPLGYGEKTTRKKSKSMPVNRQQTKYRKIPNVRLAARQKSAEEGEE